MPAMPQTATENGLPVSQAINPNDHGPYVTVTAAMLFTCSLLFYLFRLYTRWPIHRLFELDDAVTSFGTTIGLCQFIATIYTVKNGLGKHYDDLSHKGLSDFYKAYYSSNILYVACLCLSKLAIALLVQRLTRIRNHVLSTKIISALIVLWGVISIILIAVPCDGGMPWNNFNQTCTSLSTRWTVIFALSLLIEASLLFLPVYLVWGVQITLSTKLVVIAAFWFRVPVLIFSTLRILELRSSLNSSDYTFQIVTTEVFTQLEMHLCLISATIPSMRPFLKAFNTGYLQTTVAQVDPTASTMKGSKRSLYDAMHSKSTGSSGTKTTKEFKLAEIPMGPVRPENIQHTAHVEHMGDNTSMTTNASDEMIIRKTVDYKVESANRRSG